MTPSPSVRLVGNAPTALDRAAFVDAGEVVIRINNAFGFSGVNGARTTHLVLVNCGGQMREWLDEPGFADRLLVRTAGEILLPIHPGKDDLADPPLSQDERTAPDARNYAAEAVHALEAAGRPVAVMPAAIFLKACRLIGYERPERGMDAPSTGLLTLLWALERYAGPIDVLGFGFEGWSGHRWSRERAIFEDFEAKGRIRLHPIA
ncbi:hypothetical protein DYI37_08490 [Fulvimarina endophytica]|uniref:Uncharacterized protein n=1 Tax=Fulvimarina endophytica TaxID=2293836 RepID=A0A371X550_9HYPH|nr:hypothetical protein [Fulvimarina endophytica]RFC64350.1 hypothetical protein DYI37_08490 [Fulvimarina endophytica]